MSREYLGNQRIKNDVGKVFAVTSCRADRAARVVRSPQVWLCIHAAVASAVRESGYALRRTRIKSVGNQSVLRTSDL
jgi:hypothetical protein